MNTLPLLVEIGTEEIPDWMIRSALADFRAMVESALHEARLGGKLRLAEATPRRLSLIVDAVRSRQEDSEELILGPPASAAFKEGKPTGAAAGFAKKNGVDVSELLVEKTSKGEYVAVRKQLSGAS